jgi:hypothetical protein
VSRRRPRIQGTFAVSTAVIPSCPECGDSSNVIRLGTRWACKVHLLVAVGRGPYGEPKTKPLGEAVGSRAVRRQNRALARKRS